LIKKIVLLSFIELLAFGLDSHLLQTATADRDWNECLEKYNFTWGTNCINCMSSKDTYRVCMKNVCSEKIDVMICVQEKYLNWRCYTRYGLEFKDTIFGYACKGSGRHLYWVKKAGDTQTSFPTMEEINANYSE